MLTEVKNRLEATGLPTAYRFFPVGEVPSLPFLCYYQNGSENFAADGVNYHKKIGITVELYSKQKDLHSEALVESALHDFSIWSSEETYIDSEKCYLVTYTMEV